MQRVDNMRALHPMKGTAGGSGGGLMGISILAVVVLGIIIGFVSWFLLGGYKGSRPVLATPTPAPVLSTATPPSPTAGLTPPTPPTAQTILRFHGSNTIGGKLLPALATAFLQQEGYTNIHKAPGANVSDHDVKCPLG
jgi:hypothetical protein